MANSQARIRLGSLSNNNDAISASIAQTRPSNTEGLVSDGDIDKVMASSAPSPKQLHNFQTSAGAPFSSPNGVAATSMVSNNSLGKLVSPLIKSDAVRREEKLAKMKKRSKESILKKQSSKVENTCLICMGPFSKKRPPINIPCKNVCNKTPVHAKCIYEWSCARLASEETPNCPLCRGEMNKIDYTPPSYIPSYDALTSSEDIKRKFVTRPLPRAAGIIRCYIRVHHVGSVTDNRVYELFLQGPTGRPYPDGLLPDLEFPDDDDALLLSARNCGYTFGSTSMRVITGDKDGDFSLNSSSLVALIQGSFLGLEYTMKYPNGNEIVGIAYNQNRVGKGTGPRKVRVCFPKIVEEVRPAQQPKQQTNNRGNITLSSNMQLNIVSKHADDQDSVYGSKNTDELNARKSKESVYDGSIASLISLGDDDKSSQQSPKLSASRATASKAAQEDSHDLVEMIADSDEVEGDEEYLDPDETVWVTWDYKPSKTNLPLSKYARKGIQAVRTSKLKHYFAFNREPVWLDDVGVFSLDFHGRVTLPSNKNFQMLVHGIDTDDDMFHLQFGKVADEEYTTVFTMDLQWPFSILQAFGICVSACDPKIACA